MVRETGLEPVRDYHTPLKRARLPIPPLSHSVWNIWNYITTERKSQAFFCDIFKLFFYIHKMQFLGKINRKKQSGTVRPLLYLVYLQSSSARASISALFFSFMADIIETVFSQ